MRENRVGADPQVRQHLDLDLDQCWPELVLFAGRLDD